MLRPERQKQSVVYKTMKTEQTKGPLWAEVCPALQGLNYLAQLCKMTHKLK